MFRRILVPIDGSESSAWLLKRARMLLRQPEAVVKLVTVIESGGENAADLQYRADIRHDEARARLWALHQRLMSDGIVVETELLFGDPATEILREIAAGGHDLAVMATHAREGVERFFFGSVALGVLKAAPVPLLLFRPTLLPGGSLSPVYGSRPAQFKRVLVPLDGSPDAEEILPAAGDLARQFAARLYLFTAVPPGRDGAEELRRASAYLARIADSMHRDGLRIEIRVREGDPTHEALVLFRDQDFDAVAMTTHGRTGLSRVLFGSVAERILTRAHVPMLVIRTRAVRDPMPAPREAVSRVKVG